MTDSNVLTEQLKVLNQTRRIIEIFVKSEMEIRPHFILSGPSGCGKTHLVQGLAEDFEMEFLEINAAQLTKEGTAGNSLSKALQPLMGKGGIPVLVFVDEFDKLFISGNCNSDLAHETTNGVQNEFLKVLEAKSTAVYGQYANYINIPINNVLFVFAGAFNGEENLTIDKLRDFGVKTEFLGRVGLLYNMTKLSLESMRHALLQSRLLQRYLLLFPEVKKEDVVDAVMVVMAQMYERNTLGIRLINTLLHQFFINDGVLEQTEVKRSAFQNSLSFGNKPTN